MLGDREQHSSVLICERCYETLMQGDALNVWYDIISKAKKRALKEEFIKKHSPPPDAIKRSLEKLKQEYGFGVKESE